MDPNDVQDMMITMAVKLQDRVNKYFAKNYPSQGSAYTVKIGKKFYKILSFNGGQHCVIAFVDMKSGDIFMPAGANARAKHARGNVLSDQNGMEAFTEMGTVRYLR